MYHSSSVPSVRVAGASARTNASTLHFAYQVNPTLLAGECLPWHVLGVQLAANPKAASDMAFVQKLDGSIASSTRSNPDGYGRAAGRALPPGPVGCNAAPWPRR